MSMRVGVIGGGVEGRAAARYWLQLGAEVTIRDQKSDIEPLAGATFITGSEYLKGLTEYDLLVRSPRVKPSDIHAQVPVTSVTKEFFARCPARIIGITGTQGRGAAAVLLVKMLEQAGKRVWLGGASGTPALDFLSKLKASDVVVMELSSFALMDLDTSPHIAVCLRVTPSHLDWHRSMREYAAAKGNLFWHQQPGDVAIYDPENDFSTQIALLSPGRRVPYSQRPGTVISEAGMMLGDGLVCTVDEIEQLGQINLESISAAATAAREIIGGNVAAMRRAVIESGKFKQVQK